MQEIQANPEAPAPVFNPFNQIFGVEFNPGGDLMVHTIKKSFAELALMLDQYLTQKESSIPQFIYDQMLNDAMKAQMMMTKVATWN